MLAARALMHVCPLCGLTASGVEGVTEGERTRVAVVLYYNVAW